MSQVFGFEKPVAQTLLGIANREATRQRKGPQFRYPSVIGSGAQIVQVWSDSLSATVGDLLSPNADGYHTGRLQFYGDGDDSTGASCWLGFIDWESLDLGQVVGVHGRHYVGVPMGNVTSLGTEAPAYLIAVGEQSFLAKSSSDVAKGAAGTFTLYHKSEVASSITQSATAKGAAISANKWCTVIRPQSGKWYAGCWET